MAALVSIGEERITVDNTSGGKGFTDAELTGKVVRASCFVESNEIRIQTGGATLTAGGTEGSPALQPGAHFYVYGDPDLRSFRAIRTGASDGVINVIYEGLGGS